jgi:hypothetical protein
VNSHSAWNSPLNLVGKKDGSTRVTVNYRKLNNRTIKDAYPLPNIEKMLPKLAKATYFTKLDLSSGFYHVKLEPASRKYTAFGSEYGFYEYKVMPMGLTNAPATFQRLMDHVLKEFIEQNFTIAYLDDIVVYTENLEGHQHQVMLVMKRLRESSRNEQDMVKNHRACLQTRFESDRGEIN